MDVASVEPLPILAFKSPEIMSANEYLQNIKFRRLSNTVQFEVIGTCIAGKTYMLKPRSGAGLVHKFHHLQSEFLLSKCHLCADHHVSFHNKVSPFIHKTVL